MGGRRHGGGKARRTAGGAKGTEARQPAAKDAKSGKKGGGGGGGGKGAKRPVGRLRGMGEAELRSQDEERQLVRLFHTAENWCNFLTSI